MKSKYDASLLAHLEADQECFGVPPILQEETIINSTFTYRHFVTTGMQDSAEENLKTTAKEMLMDLFPKYIPNRFKIEVVTRLSSDIMDKSGFVVISAYVVADKDHE